MPDNDTLPLSDLLNREMQLIHQTPPDWETAWAYASKRADHLLAERDAALKVVVNVEKFSEWLNDSCSKLIAERDAALARAEKAEAALQQKHTNRALQDLDRLTDRLENERDIERARAVRLAEEVERLHDKLRPFAILARLVEKKRPGWDHDAFPIIHNEDFTMDLRPFREASAALASPPESPFGGEDDDGSNPDGAS